MKSNSMITKAACLMLMASATTSAFAQKMNIEHKGDTTIDKYQAYMWGNSRLGYWRVADSPILKMAISNDSLRKTGYVTLMGSYLEWHPK